METKRLENHGIWHTVFDANGNCVKTVYEPSYKKVLGYTGEENYRDSLKMWTDSLHPDDMKRLRVHYDECLSKHPEGMDFNIEYRMMTKQGYHWFHDYGQFVRSDDGTPLQCDGVVFDIQDIVEKLNSRQNNLDRNSNLFALSDYIISVFEIDFEKDVCLSYSDNNLYYDKSLPEISDSGTFSVQSMLKKYSEVIHPDDYRELSSILTTDTVNEKLSQNRCFDYYFRIITGPHPEWFKMRIVKKDIEESKVLVGIFNAEKDVEVYQIKEQKAKLEESLTFTNYFLTTFASAYYVDLKTLKWTTYKSVDRIENSYVKTLSYKDILKAYIETDVHPDDRHVFSLLLDTDAIRNELKNKPYFNFTFRLLINGNVRYGRCEVIRGSDEDHIAFGFIDITDTLNEQSSRLLGAIPLSSDILTKANIGLWSFELDEGRPPRMYVDEAMLGLIGLDHQVSPEDTYHAWYDNIDKDSYSLVADAVEKMISGEHAEVQYPWHHPNGNTMVVRCGGVRNPEYTKGVRIEGTHQDVSKMIHFDEQEQERRRAKELELMYSEFRASAMVYLTENKGDIDSYLHFYVSRLRELIDCDRVVFRSNNGDFFFSVCNELAAEDLGTITECAGCSYFTCNSHLLADGALELGDHKNGVNGFVPVNNCPVKSSIVRAINLNDKITGYLAIHYIKATHEFSESERSLFEEFANILSLSLTQHYTKTMSEELEHNLANQLRQMKSFGDMVNAALWSMRINDHNEVVEINWSNEFRHMLGFDETLKDFPNTIEAWSSCLHPDDKAYTLGYLQKSFESRDFGEFVYDTTYRCIRKSGESCWYHAVGRMEDEGNGIRKMYGLFYDISISKQLEEQRLQLAEALEIAETANKAKTSFLFNMSHDIRTPMNAIVGFTNIAKKNLDDREKLVDSLSKTQQASNLLLSLINSILEMSRIEAGKAELEEIPGDFRYSFESFKTTTLELAKAKNIDLSFEIGHTTDNFVYVDYSRTTRVFVNIISNAIKYNHNGGWVKVKGEQIGKRDDGYGIYRYTIADNGIGMSDEFQKHVFEEFSRENNSTTNGIQGTGLGLSLVKSFVDLMNGTVECTSKQGVGTTFTVTLPLRIQEITNGKMYVEPETGIMKNTNDDNEEKPTRNFAGQRVLVVDDNELNREIATDILAEEGLIVEEADDGTTAVRLMEQKGPEYYDFILMDIQMPIMSGYEATKIIKGMYPDAKFPIIALSANAFSEDKIASIEAGMNDHVAKPINIRELFDVLAKYV